ncbi:N-acetylglutaminylglutamine synthetase [Marinimicrococcus flavescens]|uniref:N-acetylglutaminylglutamine synthetase n=1 Tax=Marinimicrococcus flavescens TaxID=3031815 RepID=A0AAP3XQF8_9PROT|nr:N-acetylglutaminylglutamine synthetase [Marinimicrococcus flavescens]
MNAPGRSRSAAPFAHRLRRLRTGGLKPPIAEHDGRPPEPRPHTSVDCGWGRLLFAQTFADPGELARAMRGEAPERRDIAVYVRDPHLVLAAAPQDLFLDPSHTCRLDLSTYRSGRRRPRGFVVRRLCSAADLAEVNRIYLTRNMVPLAEEVMWRSLDHRVITHLVAEDEASGAILGTVTGIDHVRAFDDPERGCSLWCLAVDPQAAQPGIGEALVRHLAEMFKARGRAFLDLSVMHDNEQALALYEKLGFVRVPFFSVKRKNPINEKLFVGEPPEAGLNPYARLITDEARRRGIAVEVVDAPGGFFRLSLGGRSILCRESLSELTSAVALSICDDKTVTRRVVARAGIVVPEQIDGDDPKALEAFLARHGAVVVKPARGEQGQGVAVGLEDVASVRKAVEEARRHCEKVLIEACAPGLDLRLVVIDYRLVAAAVRRPARVVGDGQARLEELIERQSRRRAAATGGESSIPLDAETERCVQAAGFTLEEVPPAGTEVQVRRTANLHTGGTIHDVTGEVHPALARAAVEAARAIGIPVAGIDLMVGSVREPSYVFIEANERPGLANHEPHPTAERFLDLLFPQSIPAARRGGASSPGEVTAARGGA